MKNICIIATSLKEYHMAEPLMNEIRNDKDMNLVVITTQQHSDADIHIQYTRIEENGFVLEEHATTLLSGTNPCPSCQDVDFEHSEYSRILKQLRPDIAVVTGNTHQSFSAALAACLNNIPVAHVRGEENVWSHGISKLAHLHFNDSLLIEKINSMNLDDTCLTDKIFRFSRNKGYLLVSFEPDTDMGSENEKIFAGLGEILTDKTSRQCKIIFARPEYRGLGKMINAMIDTFVGQNPEKAAAYRFSSIYDTALAVKNASCLVGNCMDMALTAANFKIPAVHISTSQHCCNETADNIITCPPEKQKILEALEKAMSARFRNGLQTMGSMKKEFCAKKIKNRIKEFFARSVMES